MLKQKSYIFGNFSSLKLSVFTGSLTQRWPQLRPLGVPAAEPAPARGLVRVRVRVRECMCVRVRAGACAGVHVRKCV